MPSERQTFFIVFRVFALGAQMWSSSACKPLCSSAESTTEKVFTAPYNPLCVLVRGLV